MASKGRLKPSLACACVGIFYFHLKLGGDEKLRRNGGWRKISFYFISFSYCSSQWNLTYKCLCLRVLSLVWAWSLVTPLSKQRVLQVVRLRVKRTFIWSAMCNGWLNRLLPCKAVDLIWTYWIMSDSRSDPTHRLLVTLSYRHNHWLLHSPTSQLKRGDRLEMAPNRHQVDVHVSGDGI